MSTQQLNVVLPDMLVKRVRSKCGLEGLRLHIAVEQALEDWLAPPRPVPPVQAPPIPRQQQEAHSSVRAAGNGSPSPYWTDADPLIG